MTLLYQNQDELNRYYLSDQEQYLSFEGIHKSFYYS